MTKKLFIIPLLALLPLSSANAGFYVGPKIGAAFNTGPFKSWDTADVGNVHSAKGGAGVSFLGGLNLGYDHVMPSSLYLALDTSFLYNSLKNEVRLTSTNGTGLTNPQDTLKNKFYYGVAAHIGYQFTHCVTPFISLGVSGGKYKLTINNAGAATRGLDAASSQDISKTITGFTPGLGLRVTLHDNLYMAVKYDYLFGSTLSKTFTNTATPATTWTYQEKIHQHNTTFSLGYTF